jgi:PAS domain S-box-containing protein
MWREKINVLVVTDEAKALEPIRQVLMRPPAGLQEAPRFALELALGPDPALERLRKAGVDAVVVDLCRRDSSRFQWIARLSEHSPQIPIIAILDTSDERMAIGAEAVGAAESLHGEQLGLLPLTLRHLIGARRAELAVGQSEENFRVLIEHASDITTLLNAQLMICYISPAVESVLGCAPARLRGQELPTLLHPDDRAAVGKTLIGALQNPLQPVTIEGRFRHRAERWVHLEFIGRNVPNRQGQPRLVLNARDITGRREMEDPLRRVRDLDSAGFLAAGLALDCHNLLAVIQGHAGQLLRNENLTPEAAESLQQIANASQRAGNLTRQMLAYGQAAQLKPLDLKETLNTFAGKPRVQPAQPPPEAARENVCSCAGFGSEENANQTLDCPCANH